jgi:N-carbamoylputrescine amidase
VANRIGHEILDGVGGNGIEFWGQSFVAGTSGEILAKASADKEEILIVPVDLDQVDATRTHWPFLRDRRIDAYGNLTRRLAD